MELSSKFIQFEGKNLQHDKTAVHGGYYEGIRQDFEIMNIRRQSLQARIEKIKEEIAGLGDLRPGALSLQYNICGNPRCKCKDKPPVKHGPFYQLSYTWHAKSTTCHVRKDDVLEVKQQIRNYRRLRKLVDRWTTLGMALCRLKLQEKHANDPRPPKKGQKSKISQENRIREREIRTSR
jgi:hypothetical protein